MKLEHFWEIYTQYSLAYDVLYYKHSENSKIVLMYITIFFLILKIIKILEWFLSLDWINIV